MAMFSDKKSGSNKKKINIELNREMVDLLLAYSLSGNPLINLRSMINLNTLLNKITFQDDLQESRIKFELLKKIVKLEAEDRLFQYPVLKEECQKLFPENKDYVITVLNEAADDVISEDDILYVSKYVEERLSYFYLFENKEALRQILDELDNAGDDIFSINDKFEKVISRLNRQLQDSKAIQRDSSSDFCIGGPKTNKNKNLDNMVKYTIESLRKPSNHVLTGIKKLNDLLGGGFENGRTYLVVAPPKSFKSGLLMNIGIWACKYNEFIPKDPTKVPCVLYISMENTSKETIGRLFHHITGEDIKNYNFNEACSIVSNYIEGDRNVCFEIRYRKNKTISTQDLDNMVDELSLEGKEVVMIIQDYTKRIRPAMQQPDIRTELGEVVNDFCSIARDRDIPIISAAQINRNGILKVENAMKTRKGNLMNIVDKADIGESNLILENVDYAFCIIPEDDQSVPGDKYLGFKLWVSRVEEPKVKFFLQKFENGMKLEEDINLENSLSIDHIGASSDDFDPVPSAAARAQHQQRIAQQQSRRGGRTPLVGDGEINI